MFWALVENRHASLRAASRVVGRVFVAALIGLANASDGLAQNVLIQAEGGGPIAVQAAPASRPQSSKPPGGKKPNDGKDKKDEKKDGKDGEKKDEAKKDGKEEDKPRQTIKRPAKPKHEPDPEEFKVRPGDDGRIRFSFSGQPWQATLEWLADVSKLSLDWQELPGDYVNLITEKRYTVDESRDLLNRLLLDRGFTMVKKGQVLSVYKIEKIEPSLLPRIEDETELMDLQAYDFVKFTFDLPDELKADKVAEDIKPMLSPHAKIQPLLATNRILVIGAVSNLRGVSQILNAEHAAVRDHVVPREFLIRFARADLVADQVMIVLGLDPASRRSPQQLQLEQSRLQLFQQMNQKGKDVTKYLKKSDVPVHMTVNKRRNSILVNAPPAEMKVVERTIKTIDVGDEDTPPSMQVARGGAVETKKYKLVTLDPSAIVNALNQIGDLEPKTQLNVDAKSKTIFAHATAADHAKILSMIEGLDGSGRQFEVIWLRNLPADRMAATIHALMVGKEEDDSNTRGFYYSYRYRSNEKEEDPMKGFRVDADVERNRLLLWATPQEKEEVMRFLEKMGEIPGGGDNPNTVRVLDPRDAESTMRILEQIRAAWPSIGPNELRIEGTDAKEKEAKEKAAEEIEKPKEDLPDDSRTTRSGRLNDPRLRTRLVQLFADRSDVQIGSDVKMVGDPPAERDPAADRQTADRPTRPSTTSIDKTPPPVTVSISEDGRIILSSRDTKALDRLEDLLKQVAPAAKDFEIFYLQYAFASSVTVNLKEYFEDAADFNTEDNWWRAWNGLGFQESAGGKGLSSKRKLRFIYDLDTNSILVSNASPEQLAEVRQLIEIYDKPPAEDSISARRFKIFKLENARAAQVAATLKEVFRDLLSSKDKEFSKDPKGEDKPSQNNGYVRVYGGLGSNSNKEKKSTKVRQSFAGALSVGIDEVSNTVIISAQEEWIETVTDMVEYLDTAADTHKDSVQFGQMAGALRGPNLQNALNAMMQKKDKKMVKESSEAKPAAPTPNGQPVANNQ